MRKPLTSEMLKKMILQEKRKLTRENAVKQMHSKKRRNIKETLETGVTDVEKVKAEEVDADEYADTLAKDIDFVKALKLEEARLSKRLTTIKEMKNSVIKKMSKRIR
jgi:hypothetical protein